MTDASASPQAGASPKTHPEGLELRAAPRPIVRFKRGLVIGLVALGAGLALGLAMTALQGPASRVREQAEELYNTGDKRAPDGLSSLPGDYAQIKPMAPVLGPPLPGDLGRPILERRRQLGLAPEGEGRQAEAERQRLAEQALQAREAGVFFRIENRPRARDTASTEQGAQPQPSRAPSQMDAQRLILDPERDQNNQQRKLDFLSQSDPGGIYNPHALQTPASPFQVMAGSVIAASLITGLNSDLPGLVTAQVTENVYDTVTGRIC